MKASADMTLSCFFTLLVEPFGRPRFFIPTGGTASTPPAAGLTAGAEKAPESPGATAVGSSGMGTGTAGVAKHTVTDTAVGGGAHVGRGTGEAHAAKCTGPVPQWVEGRTRARALALACTRARAGPRRPR